jgi:FkbM family methyltransferase
MNNIIFTPRPYTQDSFIINEVYHDNCYRLPDGPDSLSGPTIIDIGANIGAFVAACMVRGADKVIAFEPERDNYDQLCDTCYRNNWHSVRRYESAVLGNPNGLRYSYLSRCSRRDNIKLTGGFTVMSNGVIPIPLFSVDQVMHMVKPDPDSTIWIKLDCEGSEHNIAPHLTDQRIKRVFGEVHTMINGHISRDTDPVDFTLPTHEEFAGVLELIGFTVELVKNPDDECLALFWAERVK